MGKRGPPPSFDRQEALRGAMRVFWERGFEGASIAQLRDAMGALSAPSVYAAFGSKEALFREAVELYCQTGGRHWEADKPTAREFIESLLRTVAEELVSAKQPHGCLINLSTAYSCGDNAAVHELVRSLRQDDVERLRARIQRGIVEGDVPPKTDVCALAAFIATLLQGMSVQAQDGASRATLMATVSCAMAGWDAVADARQA